MKFPVLFRFFIIGSLFILSGCLKTRGEVEEVEHEKKMMTQINTMQKTRADTDVRIDQLEAIARSTGGAVEAQDHRITALAEKQRIDHEALNKKMDDVLAQMKIFDENLQKLAAKHSEMAAAPTPGPVSSKSETKESKKALLKEAEEHFSKKEWKKAISAYNR